MQRAAGIVDQDVDVARGRSRLGDGGGIGEIDHLELDRRLFATRPLDRRRVAIPDDDPRTLGEQAPGSGPAEPVGGGRQQRGAALEIVVA